MLAMKATIGTKYDCNLDNKRDQIWLQLGSQMRTFINLGEKGDEI